nr:structural protein [Tolivirales sp.]
MSGKNKAKIQKQGKKKPNVPRAMAPPKGETVAVVQKSGARMPKTVQAGMGTVVSHTETYGVNVTGTNQFSVFANWALQPGIKVYSRGAPLGQWLPEIAQNFDTYEILQLKFRFRTACSTLTPGLAAFAFEPNPDGSVPTTFQELRNMYSVDGSVHSNLSFDISPKVHKKLLVRKTNVINLPSYDAGRVYFSTIGVTEGALIGFVDVEYKVRLTNPQSSITSTAVVPSNPMLPIPTQRWSYDYGSQATVNVAANCDSPFASFSANAAAAGAPLFYKVARAVNALDIDLEGGCKFVHPNRGTLQTFAATAAGRYRLRFTPKWDWEDLKMFCLCPFYTTSSGVDHERCQYQVFGDISSGVVAMLPSTVYNHRGFTGTATLDPNPGTDVWPSWVWEVTLGAGDDVHILIGNLLYNSVSSSAGVTGRTNLGTTELIVEYLGTTILE